MQAWEDYRHMFAQLCPVADTHPIRTSEIIFLVQFCLFYQVCHSPQFKGRTLFLLPVFVMPAGVVYRLCCCMLPVIAPVAESVNA